VPSAQRTNVITDVEAGDLIDIVDVLGRPAHRVKIVPDADTDVIEIRLNNRVRIPQYYNHPGTGMHGQKKPESITVVSAGSHHPTYSLTGADQYYTEENVVVSFIEIVDITSSGDTTIYVW